MDEGQGHTSSSSSIDIAACSPTSTLLHHFSTPGTVPAMDESKAPNSSDAISAPKAALSWILHSTSPSDTTFRCSGGSYAARSILSSQLLPRTKCSLSTAFFHTTSSHSSANSFSFASSPPPAICSSSQATQQESGSCPEIDTVSEINCHHFVQ